MAHTSSSVSILLVQEGTLLYGDLDRQWIADPSGLPVSAVALESPESDDGPPPKAIAACFDKSRTGLFCATLDEGSIALSHVGLDPSLSASEEVARIEVSSNDNWTQCTLALGSGPDGEFLALGAPHVFQGSGRVFLLHRPWKAESDSSEEWTLDHRLDPEALTRFDGSVGSGAGQFVSFASLEGESRPRLYVAAPFGGAFSSIQCFDPLLGDRHWAALGLHLPLDRGVIGRALCIDQSTSVGKLMCSCTPFSASGRSTSGITSVNSFVLALDLETGEQIVD